MDDADIKKESERAVGLLREVSDVVAGMRKIAVEEGAEGGSTATARDLVIIIAEILAGRVDAATLMRQFDERYVQMRDATVITRSDNNSYGFITIGHYSNDGTVRIVEDMVGGEVLDDYGDLDRYWSISRYGKAVFDTLDSSTVIAQRYMLKDENGKTSELNLMDMLERLSHLENVWSELRYGLEERPQLEERLRAIGYDDADIERAFTAEPRMDAARVALREGLVTINYTVKEIEDCMEDVPELTEADIEVARTIMSEWDPDVAANTKLNRTWIGREDIVVFPKLDFSKVTYMQNPWMNCPNLAFMPWMDTSACTVFSYLFFSDSKYGKVPENKMKRMPDWDYTNAVTVMDLLPVNLTELILPDVLRVPNAKRLRLFIGLKNMPLPELECTPDIWTDVSAMYEYTNIDTLPITRVGANVTAIYSMYGSCYGLTDLSGYEIIAPGATTAEGLFKEAANITALPRRIEVAVGCDMHYAFRNTRLLVEVPDYSNIEPGKIWDMFYCWDDGDEIMDRLIETYPESRLQRVLGLNYARVIDCGGVFLCKNANGRRVSRPTTYVRILNMGKSACTDYDFESLGNWGADEDGLRSLVDTLITDSYDRASAGMPVATLRLPKAVVARLGDEQIAQITAKGFTITQTTV